MKFLKKLYRKLSGRMIWFPEDVAMGGVLGCYINYHDAQTLRGILARLFSKVHSACDVGCGYGRLTMVLKEFANKATGFEKDNNLIKLPKQYFPDIDFIKIDSLDKLFGNYDFVMTHTVLQHLTDKFCKSVINEMKRISNRYILLVEKTEPLNVTKNLDNGEKLISRARTVETYSEWIKPFTLIFTKKHELNIGKLNPLSYMLFELK